MRVPARVRLADDVIDTSGFSLIAADTPAPPSSPDVSLPSWQLTLSTPLGAGGPASTTLPTSSPSATTDWFKALPALVTGGAILTGTIARIVQGPPTYSIAAPGAALGARRPPLFNPNVPLTQQPLVILAGAGLGLVVLLLLLRR